MEGRKGETEGVQRERERERVGRTQSLADPLIDCTVQYVNTRT